MRAEAVVLGLGIPGGEPGGGYMQALSDSLAEFGLELMAVSFVAPDEKEAEDAVRLALSRSLLVVLAGGQGQERIEEFSRKTLARALGKRLVLHPDLEGKALLPKGARLLADPKETPSEHRRSTGHRRHTGFWLEHEGRYLVRLSGPPGRDLALRDIIPPELARALSGGRGRKFSACRAIRCCGITERDARGLLGDVSVPGGDIKFSGSLEGLDITAKANADTREKAQKLLLELCAEIVRRIGDSFYGADGEEMHDTVARLLTEKRLTVATAESCTGGLVAKRLTDVAGSSVYMERGVVTYSNKSKEELLSVPADTLIKHGAVSEETAKAMAEGIRRGAGTDLGLGITGIAGPGGETAEKPVGLVYIGLAATEGTAVRKFNFPGDRASVRFAASQMALDMIRRYLIS